MSDLEKNTNQTLRKKYFTDSKQIIQTKRLEKKQKTETSKIFRGGIKVSGSKTLLRPGTARKDDIIKVQVIRDNDVVKSIHIKCPCGRTAELDCEYSPDI